MREEIVYEVLEYGNLVDETAPGFDIAVEPSFYDLDLIVEVVDCCAEGWRVESSFFETDGAMSTQWLVASRVTCHGGVGGGHT